MGAFDDLIPSAGGTGAFDDLIPKKEKKAKGDFLSTAGEEISNLGLSVWEGTKGTARSLAAAGLTAGGDLKGVEGYAADQNAAAAQGPADKRLLLDEIDRRKKADTDPGIFSATRNVAGAIVDNPSGAAQFIAENLPNSAVAMGAGYAGFKGGAAAGAALGSVVPVVGTTAGAVVGGVGGFLAGMYLGNTSLEVGGKAMEKAQGGFTEQERGEALREGAVKGGVITAVDAATLGIGGKVAKTLNRAAIEAGARAEANVLLQAGVDVTNRAAIEAALVDPALRVAAKAAGETAAKSASSVGTKVATAATGLTMETVGEGTGEYLGELAATGKADVYDAVLEAAAGFGQSTAQTAWNMRQAMGNDLNSKGIARAGATPADQGGGAVNAAEILGEAPPPPPAATAAPAATATPAKTDTVTSSDTSAQETALREPVGLTSLDRVHEIDKQLAAAPEDEVQVQALRAERDKLTKDWPAAIPGNTTTFSTESGAKLEAQYALMDADALVTSHDENMRSNPAYPQELQPRERTRAASEMQVSGIVQRLDPARLGVSADAATGAPIVGADGLVESGNGRMIALKRVYQADGQTAKEYRQFLSDNAASFGITPEAVQSMAKPVLVRVRTTPVNRAEFARQANASAVAQMSPSEQAKSDANRIDVMDDLNPDDQGDFATSRDFIRRFVGRLPVTEQSAVVDASGALSASGYARIRNAVLAKAYGDSPVLARMTESMDDNLRNISKALMTAAPRVAQMRQAIAQGSRFDADITPDLVAAVEELSRLKDSGSSVAEALAQAGMFGDQYSPETRQLLQYLADNIRRPRKIADFIVAYMDALEAAGDPNQGSLLGDVEAPAKADLLTAAKGTGNENQPDNASANAGQDTQRGDAGENAQADEKATGEPQDAPGDQGGDEGAGTTGAQAGQRDESNTQQVDSAQDKPADEGTKPPESSAPVKQPAKDDDKAAALQRIAAGRAFFGTMEKAMAFIERNGLADTHTAEQTGKMRFTVVAKGAGQDAPPAPNPPTPPTPPATQTKPDPALSEETIASIAKGAKARAEQEKRNREAYEAGAAERQAKREAIGEPTWQDLEGVRVLRIKDSNFVGVPVSGRESASKFDIIDLDKRDEVITILKNTEVRPWLLAKARVAYDDALLSPPATDAPATPSAEDADAQAKAQAQKDLDAALSDLGEILGKNFRASMMPEQEQKILPVMVKLFDAAFRLGYYKFMDAAKFTLDKIRAALGNEVADAITLEHLQGAYISMSSGKTGVDNIRAVGGVQSKSEIERHTAKAQGQEKTNVSSPNAGVERDSAESAAGPAVGNPVPDDARGAAAGAGKAGGQASGGNGGRRQDGTGVPAGSAVADGERGDQLVRGGREPARPASSDARTDFGERSGDSGITGVPPDAITAEQVKDAATDGTEDARKQSEQRAASDLAGKAGDLQNVRDTLPYLLPAQQEDVHKAETVFAKPTGYGMLFTNGTGTGKTFTGLGVVKRFALQGKTNTLIVVPDNKIASDWIKSGKALGLDITQLNDTTQAGTGIVLTTYANLGANDALASRNWDLVVPDEAHTLMQAADGVSTGYLENLRAITHHPDGLVQRFTMQNRRDIDAYDAMSKEIANNTKDMNAADTMSERRGSLQAKNEKLEAAQRPLRLKLQKARDALREEVANMQGAKRARLVFLSATPFAYEKTIDWANGYLFDYREDYPRDINAPRQYNQPDPFQHYMMTRFGYTMRTNRLNEPGPKVDRGLLQRQFNAELKKKGVLSGRMLDVKPDYDRRFVLVDSAIGNKIDEALEWLTNKAREQSNEQAKVEDQSKRVAGMAELRDAIKDQFDYLSRRYLLEAIKAEAVIPIVKQHLALGRKVVVFHDYNNGGSTNPFGIKSRTNATASTPESRAKVDSFNQALSQFNSQFPELASGLNNLLSPIDVFKKELPQTMLINGREKEKDLLARYLSFQDDANGPQVMLVQSDKNKGWSGHDTTGKHQRVLINLGQPTAPTKAIQQEGRIYRTGQASNAIMRYLNTGTSWERWAFATTIAQRSSTAENLGMGEHARALKDSFIAAFEESDTFAPGHEGEGTGGKARDKANNDALTAYDRAKSFYYGTQKKNSKTKAQEGVDYFATPEPVGLKMVEWLDARGGEDLLEPSGGHGAIARWMPEKAQKTVIEPSANLRSRMALVLDMESTNILPSTFEELNVVNKFDGIAMNPPFGSGGKTAIEHLAKAATHLRDGGRIVALIPTGPAADKRFENWMYEKQERPVKPLGTVMVDGKATPIYKGDTIESRASWAPKGLVVSFRDGSPMVKTEGAAAGTTTMVSKESVTAVKPTGKRTEEYSPAADLYMLADIKLPQVTFERAGTAVATRIVVIEKQSDKSKAPDTRGTQNRDFSNVSDINELFDRLENVSLPGRPKVDAVEPNESAPPAVKKNSKEKEAKPAKQAAELGAEVIVMGKPYKITTYTTNGGKELRGVWVPTRAIALYHGTSTFEKKGLGFFVRERDLPKPADDAGATRLSRAGQANTALKPQFYSQLQRVIEQVPDRLASMPAQQWKMWLDSNGPKLGVKKDEIEWSGIKDYLDLRGKDKVSKADLAAYLAEGGVRVTETMLGGTPEKPWAYQDGRNGNYEWFSTKQEAEDFLQNEIDEARENAKAIGEEPMGDDEVGVIVNYKDVDEDNQDNPTKYAQYTLPGGENYREVLLTLPEKIEPSNVRRKEIYARYAILFDDAKRSEEEISSKYGPFSQEARAANRASLEVLNARDKEISDAHKHNPLPFLNYKSGHWDQPNVLAHIRVNDRTDADGKRVLFVEEIQSDWGQSAKKVGLTGKPETYYEVLSKTGQVVGTQDDKQVAEDAAAKLGFTVREATRPSTKGVPPAPFVTKTENWLNLALKRVMMMAVEGGYDKVAFVTGEQSAERYDLSKQVGYIDYIKRSDGNFDVSVVDKDERSEVFSETNIGLNRIEDVVGKEVAKKIADGEGVKGRGSDVRTLRGLDLKVGGEGMKAFYDQIVPQAANALLKKLGGERLGTVTIEVGSPKATSGPEAAWNFVPRNQSSQVAFDVTPAMRETVAQGLPLFSRNSPGKGMQFSELEKLVNGIVARSPGLANRVTVLADPSEAPALLQAYIRKQGAWFDVEGAMHYGRLYMFASGLSDATRAEHVLVEHEVGHLGLRAVLGDSLNPVLRMIWANNAQVRRAAAELQKSGSLSNIAATEEVIVDIPSAELVKLKGWRKLVLAARDWLDAHGYINLAKKLTDLLNGTLSEQEQADLMVADLVRLARRTALAGKKTGGNYAGLTRLSSRSGDDTLAADAARQEKWLNAEARTRGFKDIDDLAEKNYPLFEKLAALWQKKNVGDTSLSRAPAPKTVAERADKIIQTKAATAAPLDAISQAVTRATGLERLTRALYSRAGFFLDRMTPESVKAGLVSDYGVPEAVLDQRSKMQGSQRRQLRQAGVLIDKLATLTRAESRIAYEWMNMDSSDPRAYMSMMQGLPEESVKVLTEVQKLIDQLSQEAVRLGQLDPEAFKANRFAYLRRSYVKHTAELTGAEVAKRKRAIAVLGDQYKGRGMVDAVTMQSVQNVAPEWWGRKLAAGKADTSLKGEKFVRMERRAPSGEGTQALPGMTGKQPGRLLEVQYLPAGQPMPAKYRDWTAKGTWEVRTTKGDKLIMWRDFTKDERETMGEIDEARYAIAKTLHGMIHDVEVGRYLEWLGQTYAKADGDAVTGTLVEASEKMLRSFTPDEWVQVPETKITGTKVLRYGKLAGMYLPGPIWNDLRQTVGGQYQPVGETYANILRLWKTSKTALSPAVHMNNVMSNVVMADWHDVTAGHMAKALRIILAASRGSDRGGLLGAGLRGASLAGTADAEAAREVLARYQDSGGDIGGWVTNEIRGEQLKPLLDALEKELAQTMGNSPQAQIGAFAALQHAVRLRFGDAADALKAGKVSGKVVGAVGTEATNLIDLYQSEDDVFRLAAWLKAKEESKSDLEAGKLARKSFLDYRINAPWIQAMRGTLFPFISFTYRAVPMLLETMAKKPHKILKLMAIAGSLNALGVMLAGGGDDDEERKLLPEEKAGSIWGMVPKLVRMPWNDPNDSPVYLDIRRWIPAGDVADVGSMNWAFPMIPPLQIGGPLALLGELILNKSLFTDKPITLETDTGGEKTAKVLDYLYKAFMPNLLGVPGTYATSGVADAVKGRTDAFGREQSVAQALASSVGVKLGSYPADVLRRNVRAAADAQIREINTVISGLDRQFMTKQITRAEYDEAVKKQEEKIKKVIDELQEKERKSVN